MKTPAQTQKTATDRPAGPPQRAVRLGDLDASSAAPEDITIPGVDYPVDNTHTLYKARIRRLLEEGEAAVADIVRSLKDHPFILMPILCRRNGKAIEVGVGARRTFAARAYNRWAAEHGKPLVRMPLIIKNWSDAQWQKAIKTENFCREPDDVVDEVADLGAFADLCGSELSAARALGMKKEDLKRVLAINAMSDDVKLLLREHKVTRDVAMIIAALPLNAQGKYLRAMIERQQLTVAAARAAVVEETSTDSDEKPSRPAKNEGPKPLPRPVSTKLAELAPRRLSPVVSDTVLALVLGDPKALERVPGLSALVAEARALLRKPKAAEAPAEEGE